MIDLIGWKQITTALALGCLFIVFTAPFVLRRFWNAEKAARRAEAEYREMIAKHEKLPPLFFEATHQ